MIYSFIIRHTNQDQGIYLSQKYLWVTHLFIIIFDKNKNSMAALVFVLVLFVLAIVSPWVFPNRMVSNHKKDDDER